MPDAREQSLEREPAAIRYSRVVNSGTIVGGLLLAAEAVIPGPVVVSLPDAIDGGNGVFIGLVVAAQTYAIRCLFGLRSPRP